METRQPDQTRARLLEAAYAEIHRHGFQAASIANILSDTGLTKGALYHHFPDKKALGLAVIEEGIRPAFAAMMFTPLHDAERPLAALRALLDEFSVCHTQDDVVLGCPINNLMQEMSPLDEDFRAALTALVEEWRATLEHALKRAREVGELRVGVDAAAAALFIVSSLWGCIGVSKNMQSLPVFHACIAQLSGYLATLAKAA